MRQCIAVLLSTVVVLVCCSGGNVAGTQTGNPASVGLLARADTTNGLPKVRAAAGPTVSAITLTSVKLVIEAAELEDTSSEDSVSFEEEETPTVLDLDLSGGVMVLDSLTTRTWGVYERIEFDIDVLESDEPAIYNANPDLQDRSVAVSGHLNGDTASSFTFYSALAATIAYDLDPPLNLARDVVTNVSIVFHPKRWFVDSTGGYLDPRDAANAPLIEDNIGSDIEAFEDSNGDGVRD